MAENWISPKNFDTNQITTIYSKYLWDTWNSPFMALRKQCSSVDQYG
jgi:hypothetical protein